jgi:hypothetical protein
MEFTVGSQTRQTFVGLGALAYNDRLVVVLQGSTVVGSIPRADIRSIRIEPRLSFKHPIVGLVVGSLLSVVPIGTTLMDLYYNPVLTLSFSLIGFYLLFAAARARRVPWLVALTSAGERAFMLHGPVTPEVDAFVRGLNESCIESGSELPSASRAFPVITQANRLPAHQQVIVPPSPAPSPASASPSLPSAPPASSPSHPDKTY